MFSLAEPIVLLLMALLSAAVHWDWPGGQAVRRAAAWLWRWARANPAAAILWVTVVLHSIMLAGLPPDLRNEVLRTRSTNLSQLENRPVSVLVSSALWTELSDIPFATLMAVFVWGPAERWLGTPRTVAVFFAGHIGASVLALTGAGKLVSKGLLQQDLTTMVDVGVSLGSLCLAGLLTYRLPFPWWRLAAMAGLIAAVRLSLPLFGRYSTAGHAIALLIGFLLWPMSRIPSAREKRSLPWLRPPKPRPDA